MSLLPKHISRNSSVGALFRVTASLKGTSGHGAPTLELRGVFLLILGGVALLSGCALEPKVEPVASEPDIVTIKLAAAADKAAEALNSIAGIEQQRGPTTPPIENFEKASLSQMQPITLRWSGPIETVVRALAERAGLKFRVKGNLPTVPLTVNVDVYQQPILHVLRDIGLQAGHRADVAVDDAVGVVEVRYAPADKSQ